MMSWLALFCMCDGCETHRKPQIVNGAMNFTETIAEHVWTQQWQHAMNCGKGATKDWESVKEKVAILASPVDGPKGKINWEKVFGGPLILYNIKPVGWSGSKSLGSNHALGGRTGRPRIDRWRSFSFS